MSLSAPRESGALKWPHRVLRVAVTHASNWYIRRLEKGVAKREKKITTYRAKIEAAEHAHETGKYTRAKYEMKKADLESKIRTTAARVSTYKGAIGKERRRLEQEVA